MAAQMCPRRSTARLLIAAVVALFGLFSFAAVPAAAVLREAGTGSGFAAAHASRSQIGRWIGARQLLAATEAVTDVTVPPGMLAASCLATVFLLIGVVPGRRSTAPAKAPQRRRPVRGPPVPAI
ncbi:MAG TPA: hypothetical protein VK453_06225 [Micromonosporaceae bacterium]|nr:hypothetical protein [Micromonosporaceae bacterium]